MLSSATKRKLDWLKAQWVNETCRNLQAKVIKTAAFCHNRALQDLYPDSYRLLFTIGSFTSTTSSSHVIIKSPHFIYIIYLYMINIVLSYEYIYINICIIHMPYFIINIIIIINIYIHKS